MTDIVETALDPNALAAAVTRSRHGAVVTFVGIVRETSPGEARRVERIRYEAYPALARTQLAAVADAARGRFGPLEIAIVHRVGELHVGEAAIAIAVAAPHRAAAFDACEFAIDELKREVAVWKQEVFAGGEAAWRPNIVAVR